MRIALDLRCVRIRGEGPRDDSGVALKLARGMARAAGPDVDLRIVLSGTPSAAVERVATSLRDDFPRQAISPYFAPEAAMDPSGSNPIGALSQAMARLHFATLEVDAVVVAAIGATRGEAVQTPLFPLLPEVLSVALLHDLDMRDDRGRRPVTGHTRAPQGGPADPSGCADLLLVTSDAERAEALARFPRIPDMVVNICPDGPMPLLPFGPRDPSLPPGAYLLVADDRDARIVLDHAVEAIRRLPDPPGSVTTILHVGVLDAATRRRANLRLGRRGIVEVIDRPSPHLVANAIDHALLSLLPSGRRDSAPSAPAATARGAVAITLGTSDDPAATARIIERLVRSPARRDSPRVETAAWRSAGGAALDAIAAAVRRRGDDLRRPSRYGVEEALAACAGPVATKAVPANSAIDYLIVNGRIGEEIGPPRLLVDVSETSRRDAGTGIQRVVRRTVDGLRDTRGPDRGGRQVVPVVLTPEGARTAPRFGATADACVPLRAGETLLMLDSSWTRYPDFAGTFRTVRRHGGRVVTVVYDLAPLLHPEVVADGMSAAFETWFRHALVESDGLACISRAVADEVVRYVRLHALPHRDGLRVGWWHLGSDLPSAGNGRGPASPELKRFLDRPEPVFLMVGTIEPRKRHEVVLRAMETLWDGGSAARLLIMGREGWRVSGLSARLRAHPEAGRRLFWVEGPDDDALSLAYAGARALLFPSLYEGYGLPVVEAARAGLGSVCTNIPVLREVGGPGALYVPVDDPAAWAEMIGEVAAGRRRPKPSRTVALSWPESAGQLAQLLYADRWCAILRNGGPGARQRHAGVR